MRVITTMPGAYIYYLYPPEEFIPYIGNEFINKKLRILPQTNIGDLRLSFTTEDGKQGATYLDWLKTKPEIEKLELLKLRNT